MQQRITPGAKQLQHAQALLAGVPSRARDWDTPQGRKFLTYVCSLRDQGVPVAWVASQLSLPPDQLYSVIRRFEAVAV